MGGLRSGCTHAYAHTHTDEPVASPATGTLILSQSNNAAAGTNRELFNNHRLILCHQVLLCAFPILVLCISRISFAFIFIAQMLENRREGGSRRGGAINADIYAWLLKWGSVKSASHCTYTHTQTDRAKTDRYPDFLPSLVSRRLSVGARRGTSTCALRRVMCAFGLCLHADTQMQTPLGIYICVSVCFPVCLGTCVGCRH